MDQLEQRRAYLISAVQARLAEIFSFFRRLGVDEATAQDLAQDTFVIAWQRAAHLRGERELRGWLYGIAYRRYLQHRERSQVRATSELRDEVEAPGADPGSDQQLSTQVVREAVQALPDKYRHPLVLVYWQELSYLEAAKVLSLPVGTLAWRVHKALKLMQLSLAEKGLNDDLATHAPAADRSADPVGED
jgi:RNA polymerase sigma factor (sigma-70 family)